jgi:type VI secretion system protein ImpH
MSEPGLPTELPHRDSVAGRLTREPFAFEFFQAVRVLRWIVSRADAVDTRHGADDRQNSNGSDPSPDFVRFRSLPSLSFPGSAVARLDHLAEATAAGSRGASSIGMTVTFMGLFGPSGVLPRHYTQLVIDRIRLKDLALRDFLDVFNHRVISLFYRAWAKYRLPIVFEQHHLDTGQTGRDPFTRALFSSVGMEMPGLRWRLPFDDFVLLYYAGHFSHFPRNALSLEVIVADHFRVSTTVRQLHGKWLYLETSDQSRLTSDARQAANNRLGQDVVVGKRVWGIENSFRLRLGPLTYRQFEQFTPAGAALKRLGQFVLSYVGASYDFDVQLILLRDEVPPSRLANHREPPHSRLGWNTWLYNSTVTDHREDAVFVPSDLSPGA